MPNSLSELSEELDRLAAEGWDDVKYLREVKHKVMLYIRGAVKTRGKDGDVLAKLEAFLLEQPDGAKRRVVLEGIARLRDLKARYLAGDELARMELVNHGFVVLKEQERN